MLSTKNRPFKKRKITHRSAEKPVVQDPIMSNNSLGMLKEKVGPLLENNEMASLSRTNKTMHRVFKENLTKAAVKKLLQHVAYGEAKEADSLLEQNPHLLQHFLNDADTVTDYAGRRIHGTAYQIALGAEDEHMLAMLQQRFNKLENGREAMQTQQAAQFPAEEEKAWALRQSQDLEELHHVVQAIAAAPNAKACAGAIQAFQTYMDKPKGDEKGIIRTGWHFNAQLLLKAFERYAECFNLFGGIASWKNNFFWCQVIGYIQRHVPACYAQAFCRGLWRNIINNDGTLEQSLKFRFNSQVSFFPLDSNPHARLGRDYAAGSVGGPLGCAHHVEPRIFRNFCETKITNLHQLCLQPHNHTINGPAA